MPPFTSADVIAMIMSAAAIITAWAALRKSKAEARHEEGSAVESLSKGAAEQAETAQKIYEAVIKRIDVLEREVEELTANNTTLRSQVRALKDNEADLMREIMVQEGRIRTLEGEVSTWRAFGDAVVKQLEANGMKPVVAPPVK